MQNNDKYIDDIAKILGENEDLIEYDYNGKEDQILVNKELINKIIAYCKSIKEKIDLTSLVKLSIRESFELLEDDIVISKNGHVFIKLVEEIEKVDVPASEKNTISNRYNGFSEEEMKSFYKEFFSDINNKTFFPSIARNYVDIYFNEKKITNEVYEKSVISSLHNMTLDCLTSMYDNSDGFFKGFAGYVFRIHFKEVFEFMADAILDEISMGNGYVIDFLGYYSSDVIVLGGEKFKVPTIEAKGGLRWNVISMLSVAKIYTKTEKSIVILRKKILELQNEISALYIDDLSPIEYNTVYIKKRQKLEMKLSETSKKLDRYVDSFNVVNSENQKKTLKEDIKVIENKIAGLRKEKSELSEKMIKQSVLKKYQELQVNMDQLVRQLSNKQRIISQNANAYSSMRNSLVKALMSKKKQI